MKPILLHSFPLLQVFALSKGKKKHASECLGVPGNFSRLAITRSTPIAPIRNRAHILSDVISLYPQRWSWLHPLSCIACASAQTQQWSAHTNDECDICKARTGVHA